MRAKGTPVEYRYQVGGSLQPDAPSYVVRQADLDLVNALRSRELCYVLNARQMGKSSLRVRSVHQLQQQQIRCAVVDLTLLGTYSTTPEQWYASFASSLAQSLGVEVDLPSWWRSQASLSLIRRLTAFFEQILLSQIADPIVLCIDEIDSVLALPFAMDEFFAFIRATYERRSDTPAFRRLTWALFGVATPSQLIRDRRQTPFNLGRAIELSGFQPHEVFPLAQGLIGQVNQPPAILRSILTWTGGQPFLTQKLCQLVVQASQSTVPGRLFIPPGSEGFWVEQLVQTHILQCWEVQDHPEHLRTIRDRLLWDPVGRPDRLKLYQQVLQAPTQANLDLAESASAMTDLLLSGLVEHRGDRLCVKNPIYQAVFSAAWVETQLTRLPPEPAIAPSCPPATPADSPGVCLDNPIHQLQRQRSALGMAVVMLTILLLYTLYQCATR